MTKIRITLRGDNDDDTDDGDGSGDVDGNEDGDGDDDKKYPNCSQDWHPEGNLVTSVATFTPHSEDQFGTISCSAETAVIGISKTMMIYCIYAIKVQNVCVMMTYCIYAIKVQSICMCTNCNIPN